MTSKRLYLILCAVIGLLIIGLVGGTYGANKLLSTQSTNLVAVKAKSQALAQEQLILTKDKKEVQTYASLEKTSQSIVPEDKDQAESVREIVNIAAANNISLDAITFPASTLGAGVAGATGGTGGTTSAPAQANAPSASSSSAASAKAGSLSQLQPVKNIPGVYLLQITVAGDPNQPVEYNQFISFLAAMEHNRRTAQVSSITLQPSSTNHNLLTFSLTLNEYIKP